VGKARKGWILKVSNEAETTMKMGSVQWDCIKKLQIAYCGHKPVHSQVSAIVNENGNSLNSHGDVCVRWRRHFLNVLNIPISFQEEVVNSMTQSPVTISQVVRKYSQL